MTVNNRDARATPLSPITSGAVGLPVHFNFSEDWLQEGLTRVACFRVPEIETIYSAILDETNDTVVPWELLVNHGRVLFIGAYAENTTGTLVIPTIWAEAGMIEMGTQDGESGADPTPSQWSQIRELAEEAAASAAEAEAFAEHQPIIQDNYWYFWDGDEEEYVNSGVEAQGPAGQDGQDGEDGVSPAVTITPVTGGTAITITDRDHPSGQSFNVLNGQDGEDGQDGEAGPPGIAVQPDAPTTNVLAWLDTDEDSAITIPEYSDLTAIENTLTNKADESSLAVRRTGATNTGTQIEIGTYFYLDGVLKQAIATIATNATFTSSNCVTVTDGGLNAFKYHTKTYTVTAVSDANSPLGYYVSEDISADVSLYGKVITVFASDVYGYPAFGTYTSNGRINITAKRAGSCSVTVTFLKGFNN